MIHLDHSIPTVGLTTFAQWCFDFTRHIDRPAQQCDVVLLHLTILECLLKVSCGQSIFSEYQASTGFTIQPMNQTDSIAIKHFLQQVNHAEFNAAASMHRKPVWFIDHNPVVGDDRYGDRIINRWASSQSLKRMCLHAVSIEFPEMAGQSGTGSNVSRTRRQKFSCEEDIQWRQFTGRS